MSVPGECPGARSSGRTRRVRFGYAANGHLRRALMWGAFTSIRLSPWARGLRGRPGARGLRFHRTLRGLAARWGRVLWRCRQDRSPYLAARDPEAHARA